MLNLPFSYQKILLDQLNVPYLLIKDYQKLGLTEIELAVILQILRLQKEEVLLPSFDQIAEFMSINSNEVSNVLKKLRNSNYLTIDQFQDDQNLIQEWYSITPLFERLYEVQSINDESQEEGKLFKLFEQEFGRALSPIEIETISYWLDDDRFKPTLIKAALREAVLMGKLNFRYIDRILNEWKKKGIKSVKDTKNSTREMTQSKNSEGKKRDTSVYYNWLEE